MRILGAPPPNPSREGRGEKRVPHGTPITKSYLQKADVLPLFYFVPDNGTLVGGFRRA